MTFEEKDEENPRSLFITHQVWCEHWLDGWCDCGYSDDSVYEEVKYAGSAVGSDYGVL